MGMLLMRAIGRKSLSTASAANPVQQYRLAHWMNLMFASPICMRGSGLHLTTLLNVHTQWSGPIQSMMSLQSGCGGFTRCGFHDLYTQSVIQAAESTLALFLNSHTHIRCKQDG